MALETKYVNVKVFLIAKIKNFNEEYYDYSKRVREKAETMPRFINIDEEKDDVEITISSGRLWKMLMLGEKILAQRSKSKLQKNGNSLGKRNTCGGSR